MVLYLKAEQNAEVMEPLVCVGDIASVYCSDKEICKDIRKIKLYLFEKNAKGRVAVSILKVIELIEERYPDLSVENIGENATLIELVKADRYKGVLQWFKMMFVAGVSFFGTAFTIMAFHNDIAINRLFSAIYELVTGKPSDGYTILELAYSIGVAAGIIIFFNHVGGRRITKDPTPIEVEMRVYESDVNKALIETADREGKTIDVS